MPPESRTNGYYGNISRASINKCFVGKPGHIKRTITANNLSYDICRTITNLYLSV